jgi:transposase
MTDDKSFEDKERIRRLENEVERLKNDLEKERRELEKARLEKKKLEKEKDDLKHETEELKHETEKLKREIISLKSSIPFLAASDKTAEACGVPTSKVFYRRNRQEGPKRPTGGQPGHPGHGRKRPTPNTPPMIITLKECPHCGNPNIIEPVDGAEQKRTMTDIPPPNHVVCEIIYLRYWCNKCEMMVRGDTPWLQANEEFGPAVTSWIAYQRMLGLSVGKVQSNLLETYSIAMSEGRILKSEKWVADLLKGDYEKIHEEILKARSAGADETQFRINGMNGWLWVFTCVMSTYYKIAPTRGHEVPEDVLKGFNGDLTRDAWKPYDVVKSGHQLDLLHVNRWLERAEIRHRIEPRSLLTSKTAKLNGPGRPPEEFIQFSDGVRAILKDAIEFSKKKPIPSRLERKNAYSSYGKKMKAFLAKEWTDKDVVRIAKELRNRLEMLFTFVKKSGVDWHNNNAERAIRQGVLHRKISGGRRTWMGARSLEILLSVLETSKKRGIRFLDWIRKFYDIPLTENRIGSSVTSKT